MVYKSFHFQVAVPVGTKHSRMDQVKFVEDSYLLPQLHHSYHSYDWTRYSFIYNWKLSNSSPSLLSNKLFSSSINILITSFDMRFFGVSNPAMLYYAIFPALLLLLLDQVSSFASAQIPWITQINAPQIHWLNQVAP